MEKFIRLLNIERFRGLLLGKRLPEPERKIIERLLAEEEAKDTKKPGRIARERRNNSGA